MSNLKVKIDVTEEKSSFILLNCTGNYDYKNLTGFGGPNEAISNITKSTLYVTPPNLPEGSEPYEIDLTDYFPNKDEDGYEVLGSQVGQIKEMRSGEWKFKLVVSGTDRGGNAFKKTAYLSKLFLKTIKCCIDKAMKGVDKNAFQDPKQQKAIELSNLLESVERDEKCGMNIRANETVEHLIAQCVCCGC